MFSDLSYPPKKACRWTRIMHIILFPSVSRVQARDCSIEAGRWRSWLFIQRFNILNIINYTIVSLGYLGTRRIGTVHQPTIPSRQPYRL